MKKFYHEFNIIEKVVTLYINEKFSIYNLFDFWENENFWEYIFKFYW